MIKNLEAWLLVVDSNWAAFRHKLDTFMFGWHSENGLRSYAPRAKWRWRSVSTWRSTSGSRSLQCPTAWSGWSRNYIDALRAVEGREVA